MLAATWLNGIRVLPKPHHCLLSVTFAAFYKAGSMPAVLGIEVGWPQQTRVPMLCTQASVKVREGPRNLSSPTSQCLVDSTTFLAMNCPHI